MLRRNIGAKKNGRKQVSIKSQSSISKRPDQLKGARRWGCRLSLPPFLRGIKFVPRFSWGVELLPQFSGGLKLPPLFLIISPLFPQPRDDSVAESPFAIVILSAALLSFFAGIKNKGNLYFIKVFPRIHTFPGGSKFDNLWSFRPPFIFTNCTNYDAYSYKVGLRFVQTW